MDRVRFWALSIGLGAAVVYLAGHAVTGKHGLVAHWDLQKQQSALEAELATLRAESAALAERAARLRTDNLDLDYLDERARALLASGDPEELVFDLDDSGA